MKKQELPEISQIKIVPELRDLIPPLPKETEDQLRASLQAEGQRAAITLWHRGPADFVIVDGHNRFRLCQELGLLPRFTIRQFADVEAVKDWMIDVQMSRRNLTPEQIKYLLGLKARRYAFGHGGARGGEAGLLTHAQLGQEVGVSAKTVARSQAFADGLDHLERTWPGIREQILSGRLRVSQGAVSDAPKYVPADTTGIMPQDLEELHQEWRRKREQPKPKPDQAAAKPETASRQGVHLPKSRPTLEEKHAATLKQMQEMEKRIRDLKKARGEMLRGFLKWYWGKTRYTPVVEAAQVVQEYLDKGIL